MKQQKFLEIGMGQFLRLLLMCLGVLTSVHVFSSGEGHEEHEEDGEALELSVEAQREAGIKSGIVNIQELQESIRLPGEVVVNAYRSLRVSPRVTAQVVARHVKLGDKVKAGTPLVTLSSVAMAEAQGQLLVADREWRRVESLGRDTVSEKRYTEAQVAQQLARAKVVAYGMTAEQVTALVSSGDATLATGAFDLIATLDGIVLQDDFVLGELITPGRVLFDISDESVMWVEAQRLPLGLSEMEAGTRARIRIDGDHWVDGTVIQLHHRLDETTRTQGLRIEVNNADDLLHPGQFVEVEIVAGRKVSVLAVPSAAVTMLESRPTVFKIENGHEFHPQSIVVGEQIGDWTVVNGGLAVGEAIVTSGVFHLKSLLLKSSLGEGHGH